MIYTLLFKQQLVCVFLYVLFRFVLILSFCVIRLLCFLSKVVKVFCFLFICFDYICILYVTKNKKKGVIGRKNNRRNSLMVVKRYFSVF